MKGVNVVMVGILFMLIVIVLISITFSFFQNVKETSEQHREDTFDRISRIIYGAGETDNQTQNDLPVLNSITAVPLTVRQGEFVNVSSTASDPDGDLIYLGCGESSGASGLCASGLILQDPVCQFASPWDDDLSHTIYCRVYENTTENLNSTELQGSVLSDNSTEQQVQTRLGFSFPPMSNETDRDFTLTHLQVLNISMIRFNDDWRYREPVNDSFNWLPLDERINFTEDNNIGIVLTIQSIGPDWACTVPDGEKSCVFNSSSDFQDYIVTLLQNYPNKIEKIQFGNEWQSTYQFIGTAENYTEYNNIVYDAVQTYSPGTEVVLGGFSIGSLYWLAACQGLINQFYYPDGTLVDQTTIDATCPTQTIIDFQNRVAYVLENASYDLVDVHLYDDVENWDIYVDMIKSMVTKPIIVTEFGGPHMFVEPYTEPYQAQRVNDYILKLDDMGIAEAYHFKLIDKTDLTDYHWGTGLINTSLIEKPSYYVFQDFTNFTTP